MFIYIIPYIIYTIINTKIKYVLKESDISLDINELNLIFLNIFNKLFSGKSKVSDISNLIFRHLTHEEKQNTTLEYNKDIFQNKTIGFILQKEVSTKYKNKSDQNRVNYPKILERIKKKEDYDKFLELVDMNVATFYNSIYLTKNIPSILDYYCPNRETKEKIPMFFTMFIDKLKNKGKSPKYIKKIKDFGENFIEDFVRERK